MGAQSIELGTHSEMAPILLPWMASGFKQMVLAIVYNMSHGCLIQTKYFQQLSSIIDVALH